MKYFFCLLLVGCIDNESHYILPANDADVIDSAVIQPTYEASKDVSETSLKDVVIDNLQYNVSYSLPYGNGFGFECSPLSSTTLSINNNLIEQNNWNCNSISSDGGYSFNNQCSLSNGEIYCSAIIELNLINLTGIEELACQKQSCSPSGDCIHISLLGSNSSCNATYNLTLSKYVGCTESCNNNCTCPNDASHCQYVCELNKSICSPNILNSYGCESGTCINNKCT